MAGNFTMRLNKYISESGICSRREADRFIELGQVFINGKRANIGDQVRPKDRVLVNGQLIEPMKEEEGVYLVFNKPPGITSTTEGNVKGNIVSYINHSARIFPVGRLDKDSQGLIFLTSNGDIVNKILRAGNNHEKEYVVTVSRPVTDQFIQGMASGVPILGTVTKKCVVTKEGPNTFRIILIQGLNRQIRRMCEYFGYEVTKLERVRIMNISLKGLPLGDWREMTPRELEGIFKLIEKSSSSDNKSSKTTGRAAPAGEILAKPVRKSGSHPRKRKNFAADPKPRFNTDREFSNPDSTPNTRKPASQKSNSVFKPKPTGNAAKTSSRSGTVRTKKNTPGKNTGRPARNLNPKGRQR